MAFNETQAMNTLASIDKSLKQIARTLDDIKKVVQVPETAEQERVEGVESGPGYPLARDRLVVPNSGVA